MRHETYFNEADFDNYEQSQILAIYSVKPKPEPSGVAERALLKAYWVRPALDRVPPIHIGDCDRLFWGTHLQLVSSEDGKLWLCQNRVGFLAHEVSKEVSDKILQTLAAS